MAELRTQHASPNGKVPSAVAAVSGAESTLVQAIEGQDWVDRLAEPVQRPLGALLARSDALRSALHGTLLGHPMHPVLTDVPVGAWTAGLVFDLLDSRRFSRDLRRGADAAHAVGLAGALGAAVFGLADWSHTDGPARRVGFLHGLTNTVIAGLYGASLLARARGSRGLGVALSTLGYSLLLFSAWLGGELSYRYGLGVNRTAFQERPPDWTPLTGEDGSPVRAEDVSEGNLRRTRAGETPVLLTRWHGQLRAIGDTCTHLGCSLSGGTLEGDQVRCPCHGSRFRLADGYVVAGPASIPAPSFAVRVREGGLEIRRAAN